MTPPASSARARRWALAPIALLILLGGAWTGGWFYAAHRVEGALTDWMAREANAGRSYTCSRRNVSGYPFRMELRCADMAVELPDRGGAVRLQARQLHAVAQVYQPDRIIVEVEGPLTVAAPNQPVHVANWTLMQASGRGRPHAPERVSIVVDGLTVERQNGTALEPVARAKRLELHARRAPDPAAASFDLAIRTVEAVVAGAPALAGRAVNADATAVLREVRDFTPMPFAQRLRVWQAAGGRLELTQVRIEGGDALAFAQGELGLTPEGRLDGAVNVKLAGFDQVATLLVSEANPKLAQSGLLAGGLRMLGRAELEGRRALAVPIRFQDGRVFVGPLRVGESPPLY